MRVTTSILVQICQKIDFTESYLLIDEPGQAQSRLLHLLIFLSLNEDTLYYGYYVDRKMKSSFFESY